jgi:hypothetical protein
MVRARNAASEEAATARCFSIGEARSFPRDDSFLTMQNPANIRGHGAGNK